MADYYDDLDERKPFFGDGLKDDVPAPIIDFLLDLAPEVTVGG